jgi:hypothetical protein
VEVAADAFPVGEQAKLALLFLQFAALELESPSTECAGDGDEDLVRREGFDEVAIDAEGRRLCGDLRSSTPVTITVTVSGASPETVRASSSPDSSFIVMSHRPRSKRSVASIRRPSATVDASSTT